MLLKRLQIPKCVPYYYPIFIIDFRLIFLLPANEVAGRLCFYRCLWFCSRGGLVSQHALQVPRGWVSQHALQVSRPTPKGELEGSGGGVSRPTPGGGVSQHALRQTPPGWRLLLRAVRILLECILVQDSSHNAMNDFTFLSTLTGTQSTVKTIWSVTAPDDAKT